VVLTRRAAHLRTHTGEVSFPGGRLEHGESPESGARREATEDLARLDLAVGRLEPLVRLRPGRLGPRLERELALIQGAVSAGSAHEAAERAERLADLLEHPATHAGP